MNEIDKFNGMIETIYAGDRVASRGVKDKKMLKGMTKEELKRFIEVMASTGANVTTKAAVYSSLEKYI